MWAIKYLAGLDSGLFLKCKLEKKLEFCASGIYTSVSDTPLSMVDLLKVSLRLTTTKYFLQWFPMKCKTRWSKQYKSIYFLSLWLVKLLDQLKCAVCPSSPDSCGVGLCLLDVALHTPFWGGIQNERCCPYMLLAQASILIRLGEWLLIWPKTPEVCMRVRCPQESLVQAGQFPRLGSLAHPLYIILAFGNIVSYCTNFWRLLGDQRVCVNEHPGFWESKSSGVKWKITGFQSGKRCWKYQSMESFPSSDYCLFIILLEHDVVRHLS